MSVAGIADTIRCTMTPALLEDSVQEGSQSHSKAIDMDQMVLVFFSMFRGLQKSHFLLPSGTHFKWFFDARDDGWQGLELVW